jgi:hypothetical protein
MCQRGSRSVVPQTKKAPRSAISESDSSPESSSFCPVRTGVSRVNPALDASCCASFDTNAHCRPLSVNKASSSGDLKPLKGYCGKHTSIGPPPNPFVRNTVPAPWGGRRSPAHGRAIYHRLPDRPWQRCSRGCATPSPATNSRACALSAAPRHPASAAAGVSADARSGSRSRTGPRPCTRASGNANTGDPSGRSGPHDQSGSVRSRAGDHRRRRR